jgi:hypothetical protein
MAHYRAPFIQTTRKGLTAPEEQLAPAVEKLTATGGF